MMNYKNILHSEIREAAKNYRKSEAKLVALLEKADQFRLYRKFNYPSLFKYVVGELKVSSACAYMLINVTRKAAKIPEFKKALSKDELSVSKALRIVKVLEEECEEENLKWIEKAKKLSKSELEKEIAKVKPRAANYDKIKYVQDDCLNISFAISDKIHSKLRRAQDIVSQKKGKHAGFEEVLHAALDAYLENNDPVMVAERREKKREERRKKRETVKVEKKSEVKKSDVTLPGQSSKRKPLKQHVVDKVKLRFQNKCGFVHLSPKGVTTCDETRWLDIHHFIPVSYGGSDDPSNLVLLCKNHHKHMHELIRKMEKSYKALSPELKELMNL